MEESVASKVDKFILAIEQKSNSINNQAIVELKASLEASNRENLDLRKQLEDLRLKNIVKDEMINIMDEEYGAGLRKKYISELSRAQKKTKI